MKSASFWYFKNLAVAFDQLVNAVCAGWSDETLSSRFWRMRRKRAWPHKLVDTLFFWDHEGEKRHCELAFISEREGRQLPPELRK